MTDEEKHISNLALSIFRQLLSDKHNSSHGEVKARHAVHYAKVIVAGAKSKEEETK